MFTRLRRLLAKARKSDPAPDPYAKPPTAQQTRDVGYWQRRDAWGRRLRASESDSIAPKRWLL